MKYDRRSTNKWGEKGCQKLQFGSCHLFFSRVGRRYHFVISERAIVLNIRTVSAIM